MTHSNSQLGKSRKVHADVRLLLIAVNLVGSTLTANLQQVVLQPQNLQASSACAAWPKLERKVHRVQCPLMAVFTQALLQTKAPCVHGVMLVQYATLLYLDLDSASDSPSRHSFGFGRGCSCRRASCAHPHHWRAFVALWSRYLLCYLQTAENLTCSYGSSLLVSAWAAWCYLYLLWQTYCQAVHAIYGPIRIPPANFPATEGDYAS